MNLDTLPSSRQARDAAHLAAVAALILWSLVMLYLAWQQGIQHDYRYYLQQWHLLLDGADPWSDNNSYGPLHTLIGYLLPAGQLAPKLFMVGALLVANGALALSLLREREPDSDRLFARGSHQRVGSRHGRGVRPE